MRFNYARSNTPVFPVQPPYEPRGSAEGSRWWRRSPTYGTDSRFDATTGIRPVSVPGLPIPTHTYEMMIYGAKKPEGIFDKRGKHNRFYGNEIVNLSGYEGYDYTNPYLINANRYAALTLAPRKPPYQLGINTPQAIALNVIASKVAWRKWGVK